MPGPHDPHQNRLLASLSTEEYARILPNLDLVHMPLGDVVCEPGVQIRYAYFPTTVIVSRLYVMEDGASAEIAVVGNDGIVGVPLFMGGDTTTSRAVVQSAGHAYRLKGQLLKDEFCKRPALPPERSRQDGRHRPRPVTASRRAELARSGSRRVVPGVADTRRRTYLFAVEQMLVLYR